jgi:hypothetical protein
MFGFKAMMHRHGCFVDTGDFQSGGMGDVATSEDAGSDENEGESLDDTADESGEGDSLDAEPVDQQKKGKQGKETDAAFAKLRREADEAKRALAEKDKEIADMFGASHGIYTWDAYKQALKATHAQEQTQRQQAQIQQAQREYTNKFKQLEAQGYDPVFLQTLDQAFSQHPRLQHLEQMNTKLQQALDGMIRTTAQERQQQKALGDVDNYFKELKEEYPEFKDLDSFAAEVGPEVWNKICAQARKGYTLLDAYESVNRAELKKRTTAAVKQKTLNNIGSKAHLKTEGDHVCRYGHEQETSTGIP